MNNYSLQEKKDYLKQPYNCNGFQLMIMLNIKKMVRQKEVILIVLDNLDIIGLRGFVQIEILQFQ